ncbi:toxin-antitoxin system protein [Clostridioides difficile]|nr:toxin-antitoxin system protein [Clostridioides difficile]
MQRNVQIGNDGGATGMIFDFSPWQLDVDVDLTKQLYKEADYSTDKTANMEFIDSLSSEQQRFFNSLGVGLTKVNIDKTIYEIPKDEELPASKIYRMSVNFLIRGKILALPEYQKDIYSDEEVFGENFPKSIKVLSDDEEYLKIFDNGIGIGIVFKHPCFHFDDEKFKNWDCGYILGTILIMKDI